MKIHVISYTEKGAKLAEKIFQDWNLWKRQSGALFLTDTLEDEIQIENRHENKEIPLREIFQMGMERKEAIVSIGAMGIAVRMIAPFLKDKLTDSPVIVIDEQGQFVIPVLSGHVGGANALSERIADKIGAIAVITTATDVNQKFAIDVFAQNHDLSIMNKEKIAKVSTKVLENKPVDIVIGKEFAPFEKASLYLVPREYILGIGCKKGILYEQLRDFIQKELIELKIDLCQIKSVASIDLKKEEPCIVKWCVSHRIPFRTFSKEVLNAIEGDFTESEFVRKQVGVGSVCERSAWAAADGETAEWVLRKQAENGMTLSIVKVPFRWKIEKKEGIRSDET